MTDKQIIIDGVDVNKCIYFAKREDGFKCEKFYNENCFCEIRTDCYYKQLQRAEQKLEKIKQFRHDYCMNCEDLLKPSHSCCGCNMSILRHLIEE